MSNQVPGRDMDELWAETVAAIEADRCNLQRAIRDALDMLDRREKPEAIRARLAKVIR